MITQLLEPQTTTSSLLNSTTNDEAPLLSFSQLLKGINSKDDLKTIQNGALVLSLEDATQATESKDTKSTSKNGLLLSLLKNEKQQPKEFREIIELNPALTASMTPKELKTLVLNAKEYLKSKILQSPEYKKSEMRDFPKTLKGLAQLANKFGIYVHKISVEEVKKSVTSKVEAKITPKIVLNVHEERLKTESKGKTPKLKEALTLEPKIALKNVESTAKESLKPELKAEQKVETPKLAVKDAEISAKESFKPELKVEQKTEIPKQVLKDLPTTELAHQKEPKQVNLSKLEVTPLFKAQAVIGEAALQKVVADRVFKMDEKSPKLKADETLKSLLRGERPSHDKSSLTADFVVQNAKVIAPSLNTQLSKGLESLLVSPESESTTNSKLDGLNIHKSDSFEVKLNEAKQMIKYLSSDVKTAIEDYKAPFTRVKLQLNPQRLGEVDLTIVQRGKNLHINLSSNTAAINTLSMNVNELRAQLNNSGINNASLNFNNSSQSDNSSASHQQQSRHDEHKAQDEYTYFENEETNEEILSSLEIIVPDYA